MGASAGRGPLSQPLLETAQMELRLWLVGGQEVPSRCSSSLCEVGGWVVLPKGREDRGKGLTWKGVAGQGSWRVGASNTPASGWECTSQHGCMVLAALKPRSNCTLTRSPMEPVWSCDSGDLAWRTPTVYRCFLLFNLTEPHGK